MKDMANNHFTQTSFDVLEGLAANNTKEWFHENKARYEAYVQSPFLALLEALSNRLSDADRPLEGSKKTMFRPNRDVRFSEDKRPYKTSASGLLTPSGTKSEGGGLVYIHFDPEGSFTGAGFYNLSPKALGPMRDRILAKPDAWDGVKGALAAQGRDLGDENMLTAMPRGYSEHAEHRHADDLKRKSFLLREDLPKSAFLDGDAVDRIEILARDAMPLLSFFAH
ncbi:MAG: DUF2461 domain-containing protein [Pseudomonadota bacterium]